MTRLIYKQIDLTSGVIGCRVRDVIDYLQDIAEEFGDDMDIDYDTEIC